MDARIEAALNQAINERTFSLEAVDAIKAMRDENAALSAKHEAQCKQVKTLTETLDAAKALNNTLLAREEATNTLLASVEKREKDITKLECAASAAKEVTAAYKDALSIVFRNPVMQEQVFSNGTAPAGNGCTVSTTDATTKTTQAI